jgi:hypothetical protein
VIGELILLFDDNHNTHRRIGAIAAYITFTTVNFYMELNNSKLGVLKDLHSIARGALNVSTEWTIPTKFVLVLLNLIDAAEG